MIGDLVWPLTKYKLLSTSFTWKVFSDHVMYIRKNTIDGQISKVYSSIWFLIRTKILRIYSTLAILYLKHFYVFIYIQAYLILSNDIFNCTVSSCKDKLYDIMQSPRFFDHWPIKQEKINYEQQPNVHI